jgi:hypothetical protein
MLLALAVFPFDPTVSRDWKRSAVFTNAPAGRAWRATLSGSATLTSELASTARVLRRSGNVLERLAGRRHHCGGHSPLDEGGVDKAHVTVCVPFQQVANCEDRAAQVRKDDNTLAAIGPADGISHSISAGPK